MHRDVRPIPLQTRLSIFSLGGDLQPSRCRREQSGARSDQSEASRRGARPQLITRQGLTIPER